jgi:hypothetical protein
VVFLAGTLNLGLGVGVDSSKSSPRVDVVGVLRCRRITWLATISTTFVVRSSALEIVEKCSWQRPAQDKLLGLQSVVPPGGWEVFLDHERFVYTS